MTHSGHRSLYQPYYVDGPYDKRYATTIFPRDPRTGIQVWSGDSGYPGDGVYLDFHKKRWPGGHRYWRVTGSKVDMGDKQPYYPQEAAERVKSHASHFVHLVYEALKSGFNDCDSPHPLLALRRRTLRSLVVRRRPVAGGNRAARLHDYDTGIQLISCAEYLEHYPRAGFIALPEGSWGAGGGNEVWMNPDTSWTYTHIYPAELFTREVATAVFGASPISAAGSRGSSAASCCCSSPPTGSSSSPPAPHATTPRSASPRITISSTRSRPSGRPSKSTGSLTVAQEARLG